MPYVILSLCSLSIVVAILTAARIVANAVRSTTKPPIVRVTAPSVLDYQKLAAEVKFHTGGYVKPVAKDGESE